MKSQKVSWAVAACGKPRSGSILTACTRSGNLIASWMKNTGMLLPTRSQLPSLVYSLTAKPRTSRGVSTEPAPPATVEKRVNTGVCSPTSVRILAVVYLASDSVSSKKPCTPVPRAWTMRSGMRSWSKWVIFSRRMKSSSRVGPRGLARSEFWLSEIGRPWLVVNALSVACWCHSPPLPTVVEGAGALDDLPPLAPFAFVLAIACFLQRNEGLRALRSRVGRV